MATFPPLAIVLLAATLANYVLDDPPDLADLASLILALFVMLVWEADRERDLRGTKAATMRLGATGALVCGVIARLASWLA